MLPVWTGGRKPPGRTQSTASATMKPRGKTGMKFICAFGLFAASVSFAAGLPVRNISGNYMEARTADTYTGPCFANGEVDINGKEAVFGWKINNGSWKGVDLK